MDKPSDARVGGLISAQDRREQPLSEPSQGTSAADTLILGFLNVREEINFCCFKPPGL